MTECPPDAIHRAPNGEVYIEDSCIGCGNCQRKKAVKCDMCKDIEGGASCVRACPTGAAIRVSPAEFMSLATLSR